MLTRCKTWIEIRIALTATLVFAFGVLLASIIHRDLFSVADAADWLWFGGFSVATAMLALLTFRAFMSTRQ
jgi:hypothetical protein